MAAGVISAHYFIFNVLSNPIPVYIECVCYITCKNKMYKSSL